MSPVDGRSGQVRDRIDHSVVFIDETWTKTKMAPLRGWHARQRLKERCAPPLAD